LCKTNIIIILLIVILYLNGDFMSRLSKLTKIANHLDSLGLTKEADIIDSFIRKVAVDWAPSLSGPTWVGPNPTAKAPSLEGPTQYGPNPTSGGAAAAETAAGKAVAGKVGAGVAARALALGAGEVGAAGAAVTTAAVLGAALLGIGIGTVINKGLESAGINDAVGDWILAQRGSRKGIDFEVTLNNALAGNITDANGNSIRPSSFTVTGVQGILIDPNTNKVIDNNNSYGFPAVTPAPFKGTIKVRMPNKPEGIFVPARLVGQVTFENGKNMSVVSGEGMMTAIQGTSLVKASLTNNRSLGVSVEKIKPYDNARS
jgi:hypothetical protein